MAMCATLHLPRLHPMEIFLAQPALRCGTGSISNRTEPALRLVASSAQTKNPLLCTLLKNFSNTTWTEWLSSLTLAIARYSNFFSFFFRQYSFRSVQKEDTSAVKLIEYLENRMAVLWFSCVVLRREVISSRAIVEWAVRSEGGRRRRRWLTTEKGVHQWVGDLLLRPERKVEKR